MQKLCIISLLLLQIVKSQVAACDAIPYNGLSTCNLTCATCSGKDTCKTCPSYLALSSTTCTPTANQTLKYNQYFYAENLKYDKALLNFSLTTVNLSSNNVFRFCVNGSYKFDIVGLFRGQDNLVFTQTYTNQMSTIALNFRIFFNTVRSATLKIQLNDRLAYNITLSSGFTSNFTQSTTTNWQYTVISENIQPYTDKIFIPIRTGLLTLDNKTAQIKITLQDQLLSSTTSNNSFWGISQISVSAIQCKTCVSDTIKNLIGYLAIIVGITALVVIILVLFIHVSEKIKKNWLRKKNRQRFKNSFY